MCDHPKSKSSFLSLLRLVNHFITFNFLNPQLQTACKLYRALALQFTNYVCFLCLVYFIFKFIIKR